MSPAHEITLILGDGTGPELAQAAKVCIEATGVNINWDIKNAGLGVYEQTGNPLPDDVIASIARTNATLKAPITTPTINGFRSVNLELRQHFDLFACVRPCKQFCGSTKDDGFKPIDIVVIGESTEDLYAGIEFGAGATQTDAIIRTINELSPNRQINTASNATGVSIKAISKQASERIARFAFEYAVKYDRKKVTVGHKANVMKHTDGLFLAAVRSVAKDFPNVTLEERSIDNLCMQLVRDASGFDLILLPQMYADLVSDLCAGLIGGPGVAPGVNFGHKNVVFEASHGSAPKYAGLNKVNPTGLILAGAMLLQHIGEADAANRLENAVREVVLEGRCVTYDLLSKKGAVAVGTKEMAEAICRKLRKRTAA